MNRKDWVALLGIGILLISGSVWAQAEEEPTKATIRLMGDAEANLPGAVTKTIALPESFTEDTAAVTNSMAQQGLDTANRNRLTGNQGITQALDVVQENNAEMAESALEGRENQSRADPPEPPTP